MLPPVFLLDCAAFGAKERELVGQALDTLDSYSGWGNIGLVRRVLGRLWGCMDAGEDSWGWEEVMLEMGIDVMVS